jgi:hypothetical protein
MELTDQDLKDIENLLKTKNQNSLKHIQNKKMSLYHSMNKRHMLDFPKYFNNKIHGKNKIKLPNIVLNPPTTTSSSNNDNMLEFSNDILIESQKSNKNNTIIESDSSKMERSLVVKGILDQIRRKSKDINPKSTNTNLKIYGEMFPGPGAYDLNKDNIGNSHNLRYKNLFLSNSKSNKYFYLNQNTDRNVGPGSYNPKYIQNPKGFISSLGRASIFNETENNKDVGPGSYDVSSSFDIGHKILSPYHSKLNKKNDDKDKMKKMIENDLNINNNTNFFTLSIKREKLNKRIFKDNKKNNNYGLISNSKSLKKYLKDNNNYQNICIVNDNSNINKEYFPIISNKQH